MPDTLDWHTGYLQQARADYGFKSYSAFTAFINSLLPLASAIEGLSPEGGNHPNPEYPW